MPGKGRGRARGAAAGGEGALVSAEASRQAWMSRGGSEPGWGWWPPSRRRQQQQHGRRRRAAAEGDGADGGRAWALPAVAGLAVAASLSLLVLLLGLSGAALTVVAAAGGTWVAAAAGAGQGRRPPLLSARPAPTSAASCYKPGALANGGPAMSCSPAERRRLFGDHLTPQTPLRLRRRYPIKKAQYASLGTLPSIYWDGYRQKPRLSTHNSSMIQSPVTVKIARPDSNIGRFPLLEQQASPLAFSPMPNSTVDPCAKETVMSALKESRKRNVEDGDQSSLNNKRRRHDSSGSGQSAFEPLVANGAPASLVPRPGSLKRSLASHSLDNGSSKRSRTSSLSSVNSLYVSGIPSSIRNEIASSYSSTRGLSQLWKRSGPSTSPLSSPASSRSQTPERPNKKARYPDTSLIDVESHQSSTSTPVKANTEKQAEKNAETPVQNRHSSLSLQSSSGSNGKRKRKIQLLSARHGDNFTLPPPPQLGYAVTSEDLDAEKKATLQWFNKVLEDKTDSIPGTSAEIASPPSILSSLMPAKPASVALMGMATGPNPLLESLKKMQEGQSGTVQADSASATQTPETTAPAASLDLGSASSVTSSEAKLSLTQSIAPSLAPPPSSAVQPASSISSLVTTSSELGQTPSRPSSAPKPSILFGILTSPPASQPTATTAAAAASSVSSTAPVFKPVFGNVTKIESPGFSAGSTSLAVAMSPGTAPSSASPSVTPSSSSTFKPIFGSMPPLATAAPSTTTASFFAFKNSPQPAAGLPTTASSTSTGFPVLSESIVTTAMSPSTTMNVTTLSTSAPVFSFNLGMATSSSAPSTTTAVTTASSQSFLFGVSSSGTAASTAPTAPLFQFGKPATTAGASSALASSAFSQASASMAESVPSSKTTAAVGFSIFGSGGSNSTATTQAPSAAPASTQPMLTFGSGPSAFSGAFGSPSKPPPPYTGDASQLTFEPSVPDGQQQLTTKPATGPVSFGTPFNFSGSVAQPTAQPAFGSATQTFGGTGPLASFGTKSASQPAFGATTSIFSFGTTTTSAVSAFGSNTQTTSSSTGGSVFGSSTPSPFTFGASTAPVAAGSTFGIGAPAAAGSSTPMVGFSFGGQSGTVGAATPFASSLAQNPLGAQNQSTPFAFSIPGTPESKPAFGGTPTPAFGQSSPAPQGTTGGSNLSFGTPITPAFGGAGSTFGPPTPAFSIGAGSKTLSRQRLQARRQHPRKK
ncbi:putative nuclear envelope pore membrane protein POM 121B [Heteronotia binoei]|uniref:putative nuclear envelope pore membrane protein POM 121B n=1 Tax=Heteronotia binoei TaxID=13085 RepID=UPI002930B676|nr:putative nuclear envelope pore membrane protein POM 121B [Heteronotia binoei]